MLFEVPWEVLENQNKTTVILRITNLKISELGTGGLVRPACILIK